VNVRGALAIAIGAGMWGLFWIPLRYLNDNGIQGFWAVALTLVATILMAMPLALLKDKKLFENFRWFCLMGFCLGFAQILSGTWRLGGISSDFPHG